MLVQINMWICTQVLHPVGLWFFMGLVLGLIIAIAGLKLAPQSIAESIRPDLVEKGKNLVIIDGVRQGESSEKSE